MRDTLRQAISRAESVRVRNALNPLLWLTAVVTPVSLAFAWLAEFGSMTADLLLALAILSPLSVVAAYFIFLFKDPDRLQSEEYRLEQRRIDVMERKGVDHVGRVEPKPPTDDYVETT